MKSLKDLSGSENNHFNLIRMMLSFLVFFCHCYALRFGKVANVMDPISDLLGHWIGDLAVDGFFALSGYLVTGSLLRSTSFLRYLIARVLRIYPGLIVMLLILIAIMSTMSSVPLKQYLFSRETLSLIIHNATLVFDVRYNLPGVFADNLYPRAVNGSLWTLPYEVRFYLVIGVAWFALYSFTQYRRILFFIATTLTLIALTAPDSLGINLEAHYIRFGIVFCMGSLLWQMSPYIPTSRILLVIATCITAYSLREPVPPLTYLILMPYIAVCCAYANIPALSFYSKVGDYSYGLYIYSFPVQQTISHLYPALNIHVYIAVTFIVTMTFSVFSWWIIEKPFLALKKNRR